MKRVKLNFQKKVTKWIWRAVEAFAECIDRGCHRIGHGMSKSMIEWGFKDVGWWEKDEFERGWIFEKINLIVIA